MRMGDPSAPTPNAACHGAKGEGGIGDQLVGGQGTLATPKPVRTVGSYWPYAPDIVRLPPPRHAAKTRRNRFRQLTTSMRSRVTS